MATVTKDFRIKSGLVVEGTSGTINGSDIITEDAITGGTQTNISVTYNPTTKLVDFVAENGVSDSTTADLAEDPDATVDSGTMYFTNARARAAVDVEESSHLTYDSETGIFGSTVGNGLEVETGELQIDLTVTVDLDSEQTLTNKVLGTATSLGANLDADSNKIINLAAPENASDAATKGYVDGVAAGLTWKPAVNLLATSNVPLTGNTETVVIDGHAALDNTDDGYRLLLIGQTTTTENGVYVYADNGTTYTLTRATDLDTVEELDGAAVFVMEGTQYGSTSWVQSNHYADSFDDQEWDQFSGAGTYLAGTNLELDGNTFALADSITLTSVTADLTGDVTGTVSDISNHDTSALAEDPEGDGNSGTWYFTNQRAVDAIEAVVPNFTEIDINSIAKQVAATTGVVATASTVTAYEFAKADYRSAEFLVKVSHGTHTEVSKIILTLDISDNIAITEYAIVGTNGSLSSISADVSGNDVRLRVTTEEDSSTVKVVGTLLA